MDWSDGNGTVEWSTGASGWNTGVGVANFDLKRAVRYLEHVAGREGAWGRDYEISGVCQEEKFEP